MHVLMLMSDHITIITITSHHNHITIDWITKSLKIDEFKLELKPKDKFNQVKHLSQQNGRALYSCL
jgi:cation transport ATPase